MKKNFTQGFKGVIVALLLIILGSSTSLKSQNCTPPSNPNVTNLSNFTVTLNWDSLVVANTYRIRYQELGTTTWINRNNIIPAHKDLVNLMQNTFYVWQVKSNCSAAVSNWSVADTFQTTNYALDCNGTPNGTAFIDSCGNCVGGTTFGSPCIAFSPSVSISLSSLVCNDTSTIIFLTSQDPNEPDISSAVFLSDSGRFNFVGLTINDTIGSSVVMAGGGSINLTTTLLVDFFISADKISVKAVDNTTGLLYGAFTLENKINGGILVVSTSPPNNNNVTSGNNQTIVLDNLFVNPNPTTINFASTLTSDLGDIDSQTSIATIACLCVPTSSTTIVSACDTYSWNGTAYTASGVYSDSLINVGGCDSVATLNLTINNNVNVANNQSICVGDSVIVGSSVYTTTGTFTNILTTSSGCDSTITTTINMNISGCTDLIAINYDSTAICDDGSCTYQMTYVPDDNFENYLEANGMGDGIALNDSVHTANISTVTSLSVFFQSISDLTGIADFTSLVTLNCRNNILTSLDVSTNTTLQTLNCRNNLLTTLDISNNSALTVFYCYNNLLTSLDMRNGNNTNISFFSALNNPNLLCISVDDVTYSTATWTSIDAQTNFSANCATAFGCTDSTACNYNPIATLDDGSCNYPSTGTTAIVVCDNYTWNGTTYTTSGTYTYTTTNASGCDSTATLNLTINISSASTNNTTICEGASFVVGNNSYSASGTYIDTLTTSNGCDSIVTTNLTVITLSVSITASGITNICGGDSVTLSTTASNVTYQWNDDNGAISGATSSSYVATTSGNYNLTITDSNGCSVTSTSITITVTTIPVPTNLTSTNISFTTATLSWDNIPSITSYEIRYRESGGTWLSIVVSNNTVNSSALTSNTTYEWEVRAICPNNSNIASAWSTTQVFATLGCKDITGVYTNNIMLDRATLNWSASATANSYDILFKEQGGSWQYIPSTTTNSRVKSGLNVATTYIWKVRSVCSQDTSIVSNWSAADTFSTPSVCTTPLNPATSSVALTTATFNWDAVVGVSEYIIRYKEVSGAWGSFVYDTVNTNSLSIIGLNTSTNYHWQVRAACSPLGFNSSGFTAFISFTTLTPCTNPAGLTVGNVTAFDASVSWLASTSAIDFDIYYSVQGSGIWDTISTTSASTTISGLTFSTTYEWGVMSICALGGINNSAVIYGTPFTIDNQCADPTNLVVSGIATDEATLSWNASTSVDHYELRYKETGAASWTTISNIPGAASSKALTGLTLSTTYEWELMAICDLFNNNSTWVAGTNFTTLSCPVPANAATSTILLDRATLNWDAVATAYLYQIRFKEVTSGTWLLITEYSNSRTKTGLSANTNYHWQVRTYCNASGTNVSDWSDTVSFSTPAICATPLNSTTSVIGLDFATLNWDAVSGVSAYIVRVKKVSGAWASWVYDTVNTNTITATGLNNAVNYHWQVRAACNPLGFNSSGFTAYNLFTTLTPCGNPSALTVDSVGVNEAYLSWTSPVGADHFVVLYSDSGSGVWNSATTVNTNIALTGLSTYAPVEWKLLVFCDASGLNNSDTIAGSNFTTANPCTVPNGLSTSNVGLTSITFNWNAAALAHHYEFRRRVQGTATWTTLTNLTGTSRTVTNLASSTTYEWEVRTICTWNGTSFSDWSATQTVTTLTPCPLASNISTINIALTSATLDWDDVLGAWGYRVRFKQTSAAWSAWQYDTVLAPISVINKVGLTAGTDYHWQIAAICEQSGVNSSAFSAYQTFTTTPLCSNPHSLAVNQITLTSANLVMYGPTNPDHYYVLYKDTSSATWDTIVLSGADISGGYASKVITGLSPATIYEWKSQASCQADDSNLSAFTTGPNFTTITPCGIPTNLSETVNGQDATISWGAISGAVFYTIQYRLVGGNWQTVSNITNTSYIISNLGYGLSLEWAVAAHCDYTGLNVSVFSATNTFTTSSCPTPTNISVSNILTDRATISWDNIPSSHHFSLRVRLAGTTTWTVNNVYLYTNSKTVSGLLDGTSYEFQVLTACTNDTINVSAWTTIQSFTTIANCSAKPSALTASNITLTSADLSFTGTTNAVAYLLRFKGVAAAWGAWQYDTLSAPTVSVSKTGLTPGTDYHWQVRAICDNAATNISGWSNNHQFSTLTLCANPSGLSVYQSLATTSSVTLTWVGDWGVNGYLVAFKDSTSASWDTLLINNSGVTFNTANNNSYVASATINGSVVILEMSGLSSGTAYNWQVMTSCAANDLNNSSFVSGANASTSPPCTTPASFSTTAIHTTDATINWAASSTAHHYAIRVRVQGTNTWAINVDYIYSTNRTLFGLTAGQSYDWQVRTVCSSDTTETSAWSGTQSFTSLSDCSVLPTNITTNNITLTSADLSFTGTASAVAYLVRFKESSAAWGAWQYDTLVAPIVSLSKSGLSSGTYYHWQVMALCDANGSNTSSWSAYQTFTTDQLCAQPFNLSVLQSLMTTSSAALRWYGPMNTTYYVMFKDSTVTNWDTLSVTGNSVTNLTSLPFGLSGSSTQNGSEMTITLSGLSAGTTYNWQVLAACASFNISSAVNGSNFTTTPPCATPTGLNTTAVAATNATANWNTSSTAHHYNVRGRVQGASGWAINIDYLYSTNRTFFNLTAGATYEWQVRSVCSSDTSETSPWSASEVFSTLVSCNNSPSNPTEINIGLTTTTLTWDIQSSAQKYEVRFRESNQGWSSLVYTETTQTSMDKTGLTAGGHFQWQVRAICDTINNIKSSWTSWNNFFTDAPCDLPTNLQVLNSVTSLTSVALRWYGPMNTTHYFIFKESTASSWDTISVLGSAITYNTLLPFGQTATSSTSGIEYTFTLSGLSSSTTYNWQVMSVCSPLNMSIAINGTDFTTLTSCAIPTNLTSSPLTNNATISWDAVSGAVKYDIRRMDQGSGSWIYIYNQYVTTKTMWGLTPGASYDWEVRAHCDYSGTNVSNWSATQSFTTQLFCTIPTNPTENNIAGTTVDLSWDSIPGGSWGYRIFYLKSGAAWNTKVIDTTNTTTYNATGLDPNSTYRWRVHGICDVSGLNNSGFTSFQYFTTLSSIRITAGDDNLSDNLNIYPNPTRGVFNISFVSDEVDNFEITVVDAFGKVISIEENQAFVGEYTKQLDLSEYPRGIYMVQIRTEDSFVSKRVVLQ